MPTGPTISNQGPGGPALAPYSLSKKLPNAPGLGQEANLLIIGETIQTFQILSRLGQTFQYSPPHEIRDGNSKGRGQEIYPQLSLLIGSGGVRRKKYESKFQAGHCIGFLWGLQVHLCGEAGCRSPVGQLRCRLELSPTAAGGGSSSPLQLHTGSWCLLGR